VDYTPILHALQSASLFDLYRLRVAIEKQLDSPERVEQVRAQLRLGMTIDYFDEAENRLIKAKVIELNRTRLVVENHADGNRWSIRFCSVNLDGVPVDIHPASAQQPLNRNLLKVGDQVGFRDRQNREKYGRVHDLNQKTVTILTSDGERWRVAYALLFKVLDPIVVEFEENDV
jgi:hypothetical protein